MDQLNKYVVKGKTEEASKSLDAELAKPSSSTNVPDREVEASRLRKENPLMTDWLLTEEEALELAKDERVEYVAKKQQNLTVTNHVEDIEEVLGYSFEKDGAYPYGRLFSDHVLTSEAKDIRNYGLHAHSIDSTQGGVDAGLHQKVTDLPDVSFGNEVYQNTQQGFYISETPFKQKYTGKGVDVLIIDTTLDPNHPEWLDDNGQSRLKQIDWFAETGIEGTMPSSFYTTNEHTANSDHGTHVASIAAGKKHGWAKDADIYYINTTALLSAYPADGVTLMFELAEAWCRQNTNGRPKVVNMSFGVGTDIHQNFDRHQQWAGGTYRGQAWTSPYLFDWTTTDYWDWYDGNDFPDAPIDPRSPLDPPIHNWKGNLTPWNMDNRWLGFNQYSHQDHRDLLHINYGTPKYLDSLTKALMPEGYSLIFDPNLSDEEQTLDTRFQAGSGHYPINNSTAYDFTEINDLVDSMCDHAHVCIAAGNNGAYLTVESNDHLTTEQYSGDPSADWNNTIYEFVKERYYPYTDKTYEVMAMPSEEGDAGVEKREYYYNRPQPPYSHKSYHVGWLETPLSIDGSQGALENKAYYKSNYGAAVNCWAFAHHIVAGVSRLHNTSNNRISGQYEEGSDYKYAAKSGTSMASPQVAGIVACYAERYPDMSPLELREKVLKDSKRQTTANLINTEAEFVERTNQHWERLFNVSDISQVYASPEYYAFYSSTSSIGFGWDGYYKGNYQEQECVFYDNRIPHYPWRDTNFKIENKVVVSSGYLTENSVVTNLTSPALYYQPVEIEIQLKDNQAQNFTGGTLPLTIEGTRGEFGNIINQGNGLYKVTYTPEMEEYTEQVKVYLYGQQVGNTLEVVIEQGAPPQITSPSVVSVPEDTNAGSTVYTVTSDFDDALFVLSGGDRHHFAINQNTGVITINASPDFVAKPVYNFWVGAFAFGMASEIQPVTINITDATDPVLTFDNPNVVDLANDWYQMSSGTQVARYAENTHIDQRIATIGMTDNSGSATLSLKDNSHPAFYLVGNDLFISEMDAEAADLYYCHVSAVDAAGNEEVKSLFVNPYDIDDTAPTITSPSIANGLPEHVNNGSTLLTLTASDNDFNSGITWAIVNDHGFTNWLELTNYGDKSALLRLQQNIDIEYDDPLLVATNHDLLVTVSATDDLGNTSQQTITIPILERDHTAPIITSEMYPNVYVSENNTPPEVVHTATCNDPTATWVSLDDDGALEINATTGEITLVESLDYEDDPVRYIKYVAQDPSGNNSVHSILQVIVNDVFEDVTPPVITSGNPTSVSFDEGYHGLLHTVTWTEEYSTASITKTGGDLLLAANGEVTSTNPLDYEVATSHYVEYDITDEAGNTVSGRVDVAVGDVDDFPVITGGNVPAVQHLNENTEYTNLNIGLFHADKDVTWSFLLDDGSYATSYTKNNTTFQLFDIDGSGAVFITTNGIIDLVSWNTVLQYTIAATADDDGQTNHKVESLDIHHDYTGALNISGGSGFTLGGSTLYCAVDENTPIGTEVATAIVTTDDGEDITNACTFSFTSGDIGNSFVFDGATLKVNGTLDYESDTIKDGGILVTHPTATQETGWVYCTINNVDETSPTFNGGSSITLSGRDENTGAGTTLFTPQAADTGDGTNGNITFSLDSDPDFNSDKLTINSSTGAVNLNFGVSIGYYDAYLDNHKFKFKIIATDDAGNSGSQTVYIPIQLVSPVVVRASGGNNDNHHVSGNIFAINADEESDRIAVYQVTNLAAKGIPATDLTFSISGDTTGISMQHQSGSDFVILHNTGNAFAEGTSDLSITLTATFADGSTTDTLIVITIDPAVSSAIDLNNWHTVPTRTTTNQYEAYSVAEIEYDVGTGGTKRLYLEHKATATTAWQSDFCVGYIQILNEDGSVFTNLTPAAYSGNWQTNSSPSSNPVDMVNIHYVPFFDISTTSGSSNGGQGKWYIGSSTPSGTTGAHDGVSSGYLSSPSGLPVGDMTMTQATGTNFLYRETSSPVANGSVNYARSKAIANLPAKGFIRISYLNCGGVGLDGNDSLRIAIK